MKKTAIASVAALVAMFSAAVAAEPAPLSPGTVLVATNGITTDVLKFQQDDQGRLVADVYSMNGTHPYIVGQIPSQAIHVGNGFVAVVSGGAFVETPIGVFDIKKTETANGNPYIGTMPNGEAGYKASPEDAHGDSHVTYLAYTAEQWAKAQTRGGDGIT